MMSRPPGLDPIVSDSIDKLMIRVRDQLKVTTVVVTHDMRTARRVGNRVLMLHDKRSMRTARRRNFLRRRTRWSGNSLTAWLT